LKVGLPVTGTIWLNKFLPGAVDRFLARTAYSGQEEPGFISGQRPDNLFRPVNWNVGAHGRFDHEAIERARGIDVRLAARTMTRTAAAGVVGAAVMLKRLGDAVAP
jgi:hypothetical protein